MLARYARAYPSLSFSRKMNRRLNISLFPKVKRWVNQIKKIYRRCPSKPSKFIFKKLKNTNYFVICKVPCTSPRACIAKVILNTRWMIFNGLRRKWKTRTKCWQSFTKLETLKPCALTTNVGCSTLNPIHNNTHSCSNVKCKRNSAKQLLSVVLSMLLFFLF